MLTTFLQSHLTLSLGVLLTLWVLGVRMLSSDPQSRGDLSTALGFLLAFLVLHQVDNEAGSMLLPQARQMLRVAWMLTLCFGAIRAVLSFGVILLHLRSRTPVPKILRDVLDVSFSALAVLVILKTQLDIDLTSLLATSALVSVVLGLAMQDTLGNLFAGLSLQLERPYQVGDWVTIKEVTGRVVQIAWRATRIETPRGESITLPNNVCSKEAVKNYSRGGAPVAVDLYVHAPYERAPNEVKAVVLEALEHVPLLLREPAPTCRTWGYEEAGVRYQVRYYVEEYGQAEWVMEEVYTRLWYGFRREGIDLTHPKARQPFASAPTPELPEEVIAEMLRQVDLFQMFTEEERARLRREMVLERFAKGEHVIEQGDRADTFYLVGRGELSVRTRAGVEVSRLTRGDYFGEMSLLTGEPRTATVVALTDVVLLELKRPVFARLFDEHPELAPKLSGLLAQRRTQLQTAMAASGESLEVTEEHHILGLLKGIFRLR